MIVVLCCRGDGGPAVLPSLLLAAAPHHQHSGLTRRTHAPAHPRLGSPASLHVYDALSDFLRDGGGDEGAGHPASTAACLRLQRRVVALANRRLDPAFLRSAATEAGLQDEAQALEARRREVEAAAREADDPRLLDAFVARFGQMASRTGAYGSSADWGEVEVARGAAGGTVATVTVAETKRDAAGRMVVEGDQGGEPGLRLSREKRLQAWMHVECMQAVVARCNRRLESGDSVGDLEELPEEVRHRLARSGVTRLAASDGCRYRVHSPGCVACWRGRGSRGWWAPGGGRCRRCPAVGGGRCRCCRPCPCC